MQKTKKRKMRLAIISDIHANLEALEAVLEDIQNQKIDKTYCLGDIIGYGPDPLEVWEAVKDMERVIGNHDEALENEELLESFIPQAREATLYHKKILGEEAHKIATAERTIEKELSRKIYLTHCGLVTPENYPYLSSAYMEEAYGQFIKMEERSICFGGHTHIPKVFRQLENEGVVMMICDDIHIAGDMMSPQLIGTKFYVDAGSVGQPRDSDPRATYVIYDDEKDTIEYRKAAYDIEKTCDKIMKMEIGDGHKLDLCKRLREGT